MILYFFRFALAKHTYWSSDPSPIIGCRLVDLIDVNLAYEDANSKLVEVVTVADVDAEKRVNYGLVQILKRKFGHKVNFLFGLWAQY